MSRLASNVSRICVAGVVGVFLVPLVAMWVVRVDYSSLNPGDHVYYYADVPGEGIVEKVVSGTAFIRVEGQGTVKVPVSDAHEL